MRQGVTVLRGELLKVRGLGASMASELEANRKVLAELNQSISSAEGDCRTMEIQLEAVRGEVASYSSRLRRHSQGRTTAGRSTARGVSPGGEGR